MGKIIHSISLSLQISEKFDREKNKSFLIESLLTKHYNKNSTNEEIAAIIEENQKLLSIRAEEESKINRQELEEKAIQEKKVQEKIKFLKRSFKEDLGREVTEEELKNYIDLEMAGLTTYFDFVGSLKENAG